MGRPDFGRLATYLAPPVPHALHDDDVDVVNGDLAKALNDGLPVEPAVELGSEPALPLGLGVFKCPIGRKFLPYPTLMNG